MRPKVGWNSKEILIVVGSLNTSFYMKWPSVAGKFRSICKLLALFVFALPSQTCKLPSLVCLEFDFFKSSILAIRVASFS